MVAKSSCINPLSSKNLIAWLKFLSGSSCCCVIRDLLQFNNFIQALMRVYNLMKFPWYSVWVTQNCVNIASLVMIIQRAIFTDFMNNDRKVRMENLVLEISQVRAFTMSTRSYFYNTRLNLFTSILQLFLCLGQWSIGQLMLVIQNPFFGVNWILKDSIPARKKLELNFMTKSLSW